MDGLTFEEASLLPAFSTNSSNVSSSVIMSRSMDGYTSIIPFSSARFRISQISGLSTPRIYLGKEKFWKKCKAISLAQNNYTFIG